MMDFLNRLSKDIEARSSRRGFIATMGKVAAGIAAVMAGGDIFSNSLAHATTDSLLCCTGKQCSQDQCPSGSTVTYTWCCPYQAPGYGSPNSPNCIPVLCNDCYAGKTYICTYATDGSGAGCIC